MAYPSPWFNRGQVDALGHTLTPFWSVLSCHCHLCFLPGDSHPCWRCFSSLHADDLAGPLLNPGTSQCNACRDMRWWSIRITCPSQRTKSSFTEYIMHATCPVLTLTSSFVTLSFQEMPKMLLCHLWWAVFSLFVIVAVRGHTSALYRRVDRTIRYDTIR